MSEKLLTPQELAKKLSVSLGWIYAQTRQTGPDSIPRLRVGKYLRFPEQQVIEWLERKTKLGRNANARLAQN